MRIHAEDYPGAEGRRISGRPGAPAAWAALLLALLSVSCATGGAVKSGQSVSYRPGLTVTLVSWKDGQAEYAGEPAEGRWLTVDIRVDYDGNAVSAAVPVAALRLRWTGADGGKGESAALLVYDPTPGAGGAALRETLRVSISNRFVLAYDLPAGAVPVSFEVGGGEIALEMPEP